ncbi:unnamed protein product [Rhizopus stolonifer]
MEVVERTFPFLVNSSFATGGGQVADFKYHVFDTNKSFTIQGLEFTPLPVHHGIYQTTREPYFCFGFKFGGVSYISDTSHIPEKTMELIEGKTRIFIVDCLRLTNPHQSHFSLDQSIEASKRVGASKSYYIGFAHRVDHDTLENDLKQLENTEGIRAAPAYDGLRVILKNKGEIVESSYLQPTPNTIKE